MTAAQRLRLVLALGVVNLVLATVALSFGISGMATPPTTAGGPSPDTAVVSPVPTLPVRSPAVSGATPSRGQPLPTATPIAPGPSAEPSPLPSPAPTPSTEPSPTPSTEPSPTPSVEPSPVPTEPTTASGPARIPVVVVTYPGKPMPTPTTDTEGNPGTPTACAHAEDVDRGTDLGSETAVRRPDKGDREHAAKPPKDHVKQQHDPKVNRRHHRGGRQHETAIDNQRPSSKSEHRLRAGRRAR